jgi:hypothetical protein
MEDFIKQWCLDTKIFTVYVSVSEGSLQYVYDVLHGKITREPKNEVEMLYLGDYYAMNNQDELMEKYHLMANDYGWQQGLTNLVHYYSLRKNQEKMKYWYDYLAKRQKMMAQ